MFGTKLNLFLSVKGHFFSNSFTSQCFSLSTQGIYCKPSLNHDQRMIHLATDVPAFHYACGFKGEAVNKHGQLMPAPFSPLCHLYEGKIML